MRGRVLAAAGMVALSGVAYAQNAAAPPPQAQPAAQGPTQSLREALVKTYNTNPTLMAQRQSLRSLDESVAIARAAGRPQLSGTAGVNQDVVTRNIAGSNGRDFSATLDASMPIFAGGRIRNSVRAADTRVEAGRADLRATEGDIFTEAVAAYMDVIRDRSIVQLNRNQVRVLDTNLQATRDRFEVGDLTRTDVAQSDARLALARSSLAIAEGRLEGERGELPPRDRRASRRSRTAAAAAAAARQPRSGDRGRARQQCRPRLDRRPGPRRRLRRPRRPRRAAAHHLGGQQHALHQPAWHGGQSDRRHQRDPEQHDQLGHRPVAARSRSIRAAPPARESARRRPSAASCSNRRSGSSDSSSPTPAPPSPPTSRRTTRSNRTRSRSPPTSSRSKAPAPSRRSAPATSSTCSTPSRNCSTARCCSSPPAATPMSPASSC